MRRSLSSRAENMAEASAPGSPSRTTCASLCERKICLIGFNSFITAFCSGPGNLAMRASSFWKIPSSVGLFIWIWRSEMSRGFAQGSAFPVGYLPRADLRTKCLQQLTHMIRRFDLSQNRLYSLVRADDIGRALRSHIFFAVQALLNPDLVCFHDLVSRIAKQGKWEPMVSDKCLVAFRTVDTYTKQFGFRLNFAP